MPGLIPASILQFEKKLEMHVKLPDPHGFRENRIVKQFHALRLLSPVRAFWFTFEDPH